MLKLFLNRSDNFVGKVWGYEEWIKVTDDYAMKRLHIDEGKSISLQYHKLKEETWYILKGEGRVEFDDHEPFIMKAGDRLHIPPKHTHRITALSEGGVDILEASSPLLYDVVRLEAMQGGL